MVQVTACALQSEPLGSMPIDYSRFEKIECSDSEEEGLAGNAHGVSSGEPSAQTGRTTTRVVSEEELAVLGRRMLVGEAGIGLVAGEYADSVFFDAMADRRRVSERSNFHSEWGAPIATVLGRDSMRWSMPHLLLKLSHEYESAAAGMDEISEGLTEGWLRVEVSQIYLVWPKRAELTTAAVWGQDLDRRDWGEILRTAIAREYEALELQRQTPMVMAALHAALVYPVAEAIAPSRVNAEYERENLVRMLVALGHRLVEEGLEDTLQAYRKHWGVGDVIVNWRREPLAAGDGGEEAP